MSKSPEATRYQLLADVTRARAFHRNDSDLGATRKVHFDFHWLSLQLMG